jgi:uncharacterized membrane protein
MKLIRNLGILVAALGIVLLVWNPGAAGLIIKVPVNGDFAINASPSSLSVMVGGSNTTTILLSSSNYSGVVGLTASAPAGWIVTVSQTYITLSPSVPSGQTTMTVNVPSGTAAGSYTVVVTGQYAGVTNEALVPVQVQGSGVPPPGLELSGGISAVQVMGVAVALLGVAMFLLGGKFVHT